MTVAASNPGVSREAEFVARAQRENQQHLSGSATFSKSDAWEQLWGVWEDCRQSGWDGVNAEGVDRDTLRNAYRFIEALPLGFALPSIGAEPDGHLTLEWYRDPRWVLSVSVSPEGTLHYAALFGSDDPRGSCPFVDEVPRTILDFIKRVAN